MLRKNNYGPALVLMVLTIVMALGAPYALRRFAHAQQEARREALQQQLRNSPMAQLNDLFRNVAKFVEPSVVHIEVVRHVASAQDDNQEGLPPILRRQLPKAPQVRGNGSGWVYTRGGKQYIITNNHVIKEARSINVKFFDKSNRAARVVGRDPKTDIAVLKVDGGDLHPAKLADKPVQPGEIVFAFGSPFQFEFSVSQGIISGKGRQLGILAHHQGYEDFIQTDAAINPGNSGGPLTNVFGEVVGMNTAIATRTGASNGLAFAIPAPMIRNVVNQIIETGGVRRGYLGVWIRDLDPKLARTFGFEGEGVLVDDLVGGDQSPAARAGIQAGDIITHIEGREVDSSATLRRTIAAIRPETEVEVKVFREGKEMTFKVKLALLPDDPTQAHLRPKPKPKDPLPKGSTLKQLGLEQVQTFSEEAARQNRLPFVPGVLVRRVRPDSPAARANLGPGAVITDVMGEPVETVEQLSEQLRKRDLGKGVRLRVRMGDVSRFVFLSTEQP
ncbi:MAG: trypsin-like peptidase domain-containing protein [Phycisphaeraceae bacterium]|nr:trypsin-like peptidase domain-containing protein [Phycisphaeraceae bacterium]